MINIEKRFNTSTIPTDCITEAQREGVRLLREKVVGGIKDTVNKFKPSLRGYDVVGDVFPPDQEMLGYVPVQLMMGLKHFKTIIQQSVDLYRYVGEAISWLNDPKCISHAIDTIDAINCQLGYLERIVVELTDPLLIHHDSDLKLIREHTVEDVYRFLGQLNIPSAEFIRLKSPGCVEKPQYYGIRHGILPTKTPGLNRHSTRWGTFMRIANEDRELVSSDGRVDFIDQAKPDGLDLRGQHGLNTSRIRAVHCGDLNFETDESTLPQEGVIVFPDDSVLQISSAYLELAGRAVAEAAWHRLDIRMPTTQAEVTPQLVAANHPLRQDIINKLRSAFLMDPKGTYERALALGILNASTLLTRLSKQDHSRILSRLPTKDEHKEHLRKNSGGYSAFQTLIQALEEVTNSEIDPAIDWAVLNFVLFPHSP